MLLRDWDGRDVLCLRQNALGYSKIESYSMAKMLSVSGADEGSLCF